MTEKKFPYDPNENDNYFGPTLLRILDENPGEDAVNKGIEFAKKGATFGVLTGGMYAALFEPAAGVNGFAYSIRHMATAGILTGTAGFVLGAGVPIAQALRKKNDPVAWGWAGFASGTVFGLKRGRPLFAIQCGLLFGALLTGAKLTEAYKNPYTDCYANMRGPPKLHKLLDDEGNIKPYQY